MTNWFSKLLWAAKRPRLIGEIVRIQPASTIDLFGWWQFDTLAEAMVQRGTGYRLVWRGNLADDEALGIRNTATCQWIRFDAERDADRYLLAVQVRDAVDDFFGRPLIWRIDYNRSASLNAGRPLPAEQAFSRERWIKLDRFAMDALAFWPERPCTGTPCTTIESLGSWLGEMWEAGRVRRISKLLRNPYISAIAYADRNEPPVEPELSFNSEVRKPMSGPEYVVFNKCLAAAGTGFRLSVMSWVEEAQVENTSLMEPGAMRVRSEIVHADAVRNTGNLLYDAESVAMLSPATGQSFRFERCLEGSARAPEDQVSLFRYEDAECTFPVVVRRESRRTPHTTGIWTIDHVASADAWCRSVHREGIPPYGLWCRVSAFATDAITHWPDTEKTGPSSLAVIHSGGWMGGRWLPDARRKVTTDRLSRDHDPVVHDLMPLDRASPPAWTKVVNGARYAHQTPVTDGPPDLPSDMDLSDLERVVARFLGKSTYYIRDDGGALFFCSGYTTREVGPEGRTLNEPVYEYIDHFIRYRVQGDYLKKLDTVPTVIGRTIFAHDQSMDARYGTTLVRKYKHFSSEHSFPTPVASQIILDAVEGIARSIADQNAGVTMSGHYAAGLLYQPYTRQFWMQDGDRRPHFVLP